VSGKSAAHAPLTCSASTRSAESQSIKETRRLPQRDFYTQGRPIDDLLEAQIAAKCNAVAYACRERFGVQIKICQHKKYSPLALHVQLCLFSFSAATVNKGLCVLYRKW